jgi:hypothetical protein
VSDAPQSRWWIIGQWHDQPDHARGERCDGFPSGNLPVLLGLGEFQGKLGSGIGIAYGPVFIEPGKWHSIAVEIRWSQKADGKATFFLDEKRVGFKIDWSGTTDQSISIPAIDWKRRYRK